MIGSALIIHGKVGILKLSLSDVKDRVCVLRAAIVQQHRLCGMPAEILHGEGISH